MKFYKDDIVEVINLQKYDSHFRLQIGHRYYVTDKPFIMGGNPDNLVPIIGSEGLRADVDVLNVTLYKRPIKNWVKFIFSKTFALLK